MSSSPSPGLLSAPLSPSFAVGRVAVTVVVLRLWQAQPQRRSHSHMSGDFGRSIAGVLWHWVTTGYRSSPSNPAPSCKWSGHRSRSPSSWLAFASSLGAPSSSAAVASLMSAWSLELGGRWGAGHPSRCPSRSCPSGSRRPSSLIRLDPREVGCRYIARRNTG